MKRPFPKWIKNKELVPPENGWEERTWYICSVKYNSANPRHKTLFYTGFLDTEGDPAGYNGLVPLNGPDRENLPAQWHEVLSLVAVKKLCDSEGKAEN